MDKEVNGRNYISCGSWKSEWLSESSDTGESVPRY